MFDTINYCKTPEKVSTKESIQVIHEAYLQLLAIEKGLENLDNKWIIAKLKNLMEKSGHIGFN